MLIEKKKKMLRLTVVLLNVERSMSGSNESPDTFYENKLQNVNVTYAM